MRKLLCLLNIHNYQNTERDYLTVENGGYKVIKTPCQRCKCGKFSSEYAKQEWAKFKQGSSEVEG